MREPKKHVAADGTESWQVRFKYGISQKSGKPKERSETFYDKDAADEFAGVLKALGPAGALAWLESQRAEQDNESMTLDEWAGRHIAMLTDITDGTRGEYTRQYEHAWSPRLGYLPMSAIDGESVRLALIDFAATGNDGKQYADKTVRNYHGLLFAIFDTAVDKGEIGRNPCKGVKLPRRSEHEEEEHRYLSHEEFRVAVACTKERYRPVVYFLAGTGCRWSEMSALLIRDLNLKAGTVLIRQGVKWARGRQKATIGPPKTKRSRRTITLPRQLTDMLREEIAGRGPNEHVFLAPRGGRLHQGSFWTRVWKPALDKADLDDPQPRIHDLRHSHASWLIAAGNPLPVIQRRLGHQSIQTTVDTYGHLAPDLQLAAAQAADLALGDMGALELSAGPETPADDS